MRLSRQEGRRRAEDTAGISRSPSRIQSFIRTHKRQEGRKTGEWSGGQDGGTEIKANNDGREKPILIIQLNVEVMLEGPRDVRTDGRMDERVSGLQMAFRCVCLFTTSGC